MVGVFGVGLAVRFSPKDLGLSVEIYGTIFGQLRLDLWTVFERYGAELLCLFLAVPRRIVGLLIGPCVLFCVMAKDE